MSKEKQATSDKSTSDKQENGVAVMDRPQTAITTTAGSFQSQSDALAALGKMDKGIPLNGSFLDLEPGEELLCYVVGLTKVDSLNGESGEKSTAIRLLSQEGRILLGANAVIVNYLEDVARVAQESRIAAAFSITCIGSAESTNYKGGRYKTYDIRPLYNQKLS